MCVLLFDMFKLAPISAQMSEIIHPNYSSIIEFNLKYTHRFRTSITQIKMCGIVSIIACSHQKDLFLKCEN